MDWDTLALLVDWERRTRMDEGTVVLLDGKDVDEDGWGHAGAAGRRIGIRWYYWTVGSGKTGRGRTRWRCWLGKRRTETLVPLYGTERGREAWMGTC